MSFRTDCIYYIKNIQNGKMYIGKTGSYRSRITQHFINLRCGVHKEKLLQADFNRVGRQGFSYGILKDGNLERDDERVFMVKYETYNPHKGYNVSDPHFIRSTRNCGKRALTKTGRRLMMEGKLEGLTPKQWRLAYGKTMDECAHALGVHVNTYRVLEETPSKFKIGQADAFCKFIGVPAEYVIFLP